MFGLGRDRKRALVRTVGGAAVELARYLTASPQSRIRRWRELRALDDHLLADIGLSRCDVELGPWSAHHMKAMAEERNGMADLIKDIQIRDAADADMAEVQHIYAHHVLKGLATFEEVPPTVDEMMRRRAAVAEAGLPYLVAIVDGRVAGYSYATSYRPRPAYRHTIEDSVYVSEALRGRRIGAALLDALIARCEAGPWRQMLAVIGNSSNAGSIALHGRFGFQPVGTLQSVGFKLGQWVDTVLMQRALGPGAATRPSDAAEPAEKR